jgi:hypothetical protein
MRRSSFSARVTMKGNFERDALAGALESASVGNDNALF